MSFDLTRVANNLLDIPEFEASASEAAVITSLADWADENGQAIPSHETLAKRTRYSVATIKRAIEGLIKRGVLEKSHRRYAGQQTSNVYTLLIERIYNDLKSRVKKVIKRISPKHVDNLKTAVDKKKSCSSLSKKLQLTVSYDPTSDPTRTNNTANATSFENENCGKIHVNALRPGKRFRAAAKNIMADKQTRVDTQFKKFQAYNAHRPPMTREQWLSLWRAWDERHVPTRFIRRNGRRLNAEPMAKLPDALADELAPCGMAW